MVKNSQFGSFLAAPCVILCTVLAFSVWGAYRPPAGEKTALRGPNGSSILPGGRVVQPLGDQVPTGPGPWAIAASPSGRRVATANLGPDRSSVTILEQDRKGEWSLRNVLTPASGGIAFANEKSIWVSEGAGGSVRLLDVESGSRKRSLDLGEGGFSGDLAFDAARSLLFVADQAHGRVVAFDTGAAHDARSGRPVGEIKTEGHLQAIALTPAGKRVYVLSSNSIAVIDVTNAASPKPVSSIASENPGGRILVTRAAVFVSNPRDDSILVIDPVTNLVRMTVPLRIPGLESLRGIQPLGMAYDESRHWLLVAEAGINAVAVVDVRGAIQGQVLGHLPVGWFPTSILYSNGIALVANSRGHGAGPSSLRLRADDFEFGGVFRRGSISRFELPAGDFAKSTRLVLATNGLLELPDRPYPNVSIRHVVIILKGSRTFDDVLGDIQIPGSVVDGAPALARFGIEGYADGGRKTFSLQQIPVTPNHHALARQFTFSDNFYADPDQLGDGLREHLARYHVSFLDFGEAFDSKIQDQSRASLLIAGLDRKYRKTGVTFPQVTLIHLPNDKTAAPRPQDGYPYAASYAADNDLALGRIVDYLSHSPWWRETAIFVTEADASDGRDHIDAHRTIFLGVGPFFRRGYCSHVNADYAAVLKAAFRLMNVPPWTLADVSAADLGDMFTTEPDYSPYVAQPIDPRLFDPSKLTSPSE